VIPASHAAQAGQAMAGAQVTILEEVGHVPQIEDVEGFVRAVERFLAAPPG
jgi:pimeloyl-ACP methyl ester carboxylesterase